MMKKLLPTFFIIVISSALLVACGGEEVEETPNEVIHTEDNEDVDKDSKEDESNIENDETSEIDEYVREYNEEILNSDEVRLVLKEIRKQDGNMMNRGYYLDFEVENKLDIDVIVKSIKESADGKMIDDMVQFVETIEANSTRNVEMKILSYQADLPDITEVIKMVIVVLEEEKATEINEYDAEIHI